LFFLERAGKVNEILLTGKPETIRSVYGLNLMQKIYNPEPGLIPIYLFYNNLKIITTNGSIRQANNNNISSGILCKFVNH
jgi:hypothetical protein